MSRSASLERLGTKRRQAKYILACSFCHCQHRGRKIQHLHLPDKLCFRMRNRPRAQKAHFGPRPRPVRTLGVILKHSRGRSTKPRQARAVEPNTALILDSHASDFAFCHPSFLAPHGLLLTQPYKARCIYPGYGSSFDIAKPWIMDVVPGPCSSRR